MSAPSLSPQPILAKPDPLVSPVTLNDGHIHITFRFFERASQAPYQFEQILKRGIDIVGASLGLLAISPLLGAIALLIKLGSDGPILYKSERIGKNYQPFYMYKFRTMGVDADIKRDALREQANLQGELFKLTNDPRITKVGKILRALSLDELPQLLNVLRGEMSLVGPRPLPPDESSLFAEPYTLRFHVYPGMTGLWQVSGRSKLNFDQLCNLEMTYVLDWSLINDIKILLKTLPAVLESRGAC